MSGDPLAGVACITFDNMGAAADIGAGLTGDADDHHPSFAGYDRILAMLERTGVRSTFFIEGWNGVHHPAAVRRLIDAGHEVGMHGWLHEDWGDLDHASEAELAERATTALTAAAGTEVVGFRAPGGSRTSHTETILDGLGYRYDASLAERPGVAVDDPTGSRLLPSGLAQIPFSWGGVDGAHYLREEPATPAAVAAHWLRTLERAQQVGRPFVVISHAFVSGVDEARMTALEAVITAVAANPAIEVLTMAAAAERLLRTNGRT